MRIAEQEGRLTRWQDLLDELQPRQIAVLMAYDRSYSLAAERKKKARRDDVKWAIGLAGLCNMLSTSGRSVDPNELLAMLDPSAGASVRHVSPEAAAAMVNRIDAGARRP